MVMIIIKNDLCFLINFGDSVDLSKIVVSSRCKFFADI